MNRLLSIGVVLCFVFLLFSFSTEYVSGDLAYYEMQMEKNEIPKITGKSLSELKRISKDLRDYLRVGDEKLLTPHFSETEVEHMVDVYALFDRMRTMTVWAIGLLFICFYGLSGRIGIVHGIQSVGKHALILTLILAVLAGLVALNFHRAWFLFHEIFFSNELWLMNPETDLMIQMLPETFFMGMVKRIATTMIAGLLFLSGFTFLKGEGHGTQ